jgi:hypothetical protein
MKRPGLLGGLLALIAAVLPLDTARAAQAVMCAPASSVGTQSRQVTNPTTGASYSLNGFGCAVIGVADIGYFISQGFSQGPAGGSIVYNTGAQAGAVNLQVGTIPAGTYIQHVIIQNTTANATTGTVVGSTSGGADIVAAVAIPGTAVPQDTTLLAHTFAAQTAVFIGATTWNNANLNVTVVWGYF